LEEKVGLNCFIKTESKKQKLASFVMISILTFFGILGFLQTASAIQCYECVGGQCTSFSAAKLVTCPNNNDLCSSFGTYLRNNISIPWNPATHLVNARLQCVTIQSKSSAACIMKGSTMIGKCLADASVGYELNCANCCEGDGCNDYVTDWQTTDRNSSMNIKASTVSIIVGALFVLFMQ